MEYKPEATGGSEERPGTLLTLGLLAPIVSAASGDSGSDFPVGAHPCRRSTRLADCLDAQSKRTRLPACYCHLRFRNGGRVTAGSPILTPRFGERYLHIEAVLEGERPEAPFRFRSFLRRDVAFAVWLRSSQGVEQNVQVADDRHEKSVVDSDAVGNHALHEGDDCAAHDGHVHDA
jgi:hypothetical protein